MKIEKGSIAVLLVSTAILFIYFSYHITNIGSLIYSPYGDGIKNYYTLAYYLKHDTGNHFSGMNYPYGEHIIFTDNQPLLAWSLKLFTPLFHQLSNHVHTVIASLFFLSLMLTSFLVYKILRQFNMEEWMAVAFACLISFLSPQMRRILGHYSLIYSSIIPLVIFLVVRFFKTGQSRKYALLITLTITASGFLHVYFLAMTGMFVFLTAFFFLLLNLKQFSSSVPRAVYLVISALAPFVFLKTYLFVTDNVFDRPNQPWGFIDIRTRIDEIFLSNYSFTGEVFGKFHSYEIGVYSEGGGYIGLIAFLTCLFFSILLLTRPKKTYRTLNCISPFNYMIPAAVSVLLFAMAFPFSIHGMEKYYNLMPSFIKQFRASGRFNWVFYYTITIFTALTVERLFQTLRNKNRYVGLLFISTVLSVWFIEMNMIVVRYARGFKDESASIDELKATEKMKLLFKKSGKMFADFQAIFPLPFFLNGSEKLYVLSEHPNLAMNASLQTGLPIVCGEMSRTSESFTFKIANLLSEHSIRKDILLDYKNSKPLLLVVADCDLKPAEQKLLEHAKFLFTDGEAKFFELPLSAFSDNTKEIKTYFTNHKTELINHGKYLSEDSTPDVVLKTFDTETKDYASFGSGALYNPNGTFPLFCDSLPNAKDSTNYELSVWMYADNRSPSFPSIKVRQLNSSKSITVNTYESLGKFSTNTFGKWVRCTIDFHLHNKKNILYLMGEGDFASYDELLIRPKKTNVYSHTSEGGKLFMYNNYPIE